MDRLNEGTQFDLTQFAEELRQLSVDDQKERDDGFVWRNDEETEFSWCPALSKRCIAAVVEALKNQPHKTNEIMTAVDQFLSRSTRTTIDEIINTSNSAKRSGGLWKIIEGFREKDIFWREVTAALVQESGSSVAGNIAQTRVGAVVTIGK